MSKDMVKMILLVMTLISILTTVSIRMSEEKVMPMGMERAGCEIEGSYYTFDIMMPVGVDKEIYSAQFCNSIHIDPSIMYKSNHTY